ncbi:hypothetical protein [Desulforhopalus sp. 52FAK]
MIFNKGMNKAELVKEIDDFRNGIIANNSAIESNAVWLFVTTVGCYSVTPNLLRMFAMLLVIVFCYKATDELKVIEKKYSEFVERITLCIENGDIEKAEKDTLKNNLSKLSKDLLSYKSLFVTTPKFNMAYLFWSISLLYFLYLIKRNPSSLLVTL